jgi:hypothetical protein
MQTAPTFEPTTSSVPGVIPEPARVHADATAARQRPPATPTPGNTTKPAASPSRRNAASVALTRLLSIIRGDKSLVGAYPAAWHRAGTAREVNDAIGHDHHEVTTGQSAAAPEQTMAEPAAPSALAAPTTISVVRTGG